MNILDFPVDSNTIVQGQACIQRKSLKTSTRIYPFLATTFFNTCATLKVNDGHIALHGCHIQCNCGDLASSLAGLIPGR